MIKSPHKLALMGIECWRLRKRQIVPGLNKFSACLLRRGKMAGELLVIYEPVTGEAAAKGNELLQAILAVFAAEVTELPAIDQTVFHAQLPVLAFVDDELPLTIPALLAKLPSLSAMLQNPGLKRVVWSTIKPLISDK